MGLIVMVFMIRDSCGLRFFSFVWGIVFLVKARSGRHFGDFQHLVNCISGLAI